MDNFVEDLMITGVVMIGLAVMIIPPAAAVAITENYWWLAIGLVTFPLGIGILGTLFR